MSAASTSMLGFIVWITLVLFGQRVLCSEDVFVGGQRCFVWIMDFSSTAFPQIGIAVHV